MSAKLGAMTLPFRGYSFEQALDGIAEAGLHYVCLGLPHDGRLVPHPDDSEAQWQRVIDACASRKLLPGMFFCQTHAEHENGEQVWIKAVRHAAMAGIRYILGLGTWSYRDPQNLLAGRKCFHELAAEEDRWVAVMKQVCAEATQCGVIVLIKPHSGNTATALDCRLTLQAVGSSAMAVCYDGGNVRFYEGVDAVADLPLIVDRVGALCLKDHRGPRLHSDFPPPGEGCVDHAGMFRILQQAGFAGPMFIERVDGEEDAARMDYREIVARLTRSVQMIKRAAGEAKLPLTT